MEKQVREDVQQAGKLRPKGPCILLLPLQPQSKACSSRDAWSQSCREQKLWGCCCLNCPCCALVFPTVGVCGVRVHQICVPALGSSLPEL